MRKGISIIKKTRVKSNMGSIGISMVIGIIAIISLLAPEISEASPFAATYGGTGKAYSIQQTSDSGYIVAGANGGDFRVLKLDSSGSVTWQKTYGGSNTSDDAYSIQQTTDGGYIVAGETSFGAGGRDFWVLKLDSSGNVTWQKTYGGSNFDRAYSIQQTTDGGYVVTGLADSFGASGDDFWVLKLDSSGNVTWQKTYGESNSDRANSIQQTTDGGYIVAGETRSFGSGLSDVWVLKLDSSGNVTWQKTYGESNKYERAYSIQQTTDGGYIVAGYRSSDFWVLKLDNSGNVIWQKTYGEKNLYDWAWAEAYSIQQTTDGGYIVAGYRAIELVALTLIRDVWVLKLDSSGNVTWQKAYGESNTYEHAYSIQQTTDGGYIVTGFASADFFVLKLDEDGIIPECSLGESTTAQVNDTTVTGIDSNAPSENTNATITTTSVSPVDTSVELNYICAPSTEAPQVSSISPTQVEASTFELTINGSNFDSGAVDQIYWKADGHFVGQGTVLSRSSTQLVVQEAMGGAAPGTYQVEVKNSDGTRSNRVDLVVTADNSCCGYNDPGNPYPCGICDKTDSPYFGTKGNCTWWASYKRPDFPNESWGHAWQWKDNVPNEFRTGSTPIIGAVVVYPVSPSFPEYGHVAYVTKVHNGSYDVSEMGYCAWGEGVHYATRNTGAYTGETYIYFKPQTSWEFNTDEFPEGWTFPFQNVEDYSVGGGIFYIDPDTSDPYIYNNFISANAEEYNAVQIRMASNAPDGVGTVYFTTSGSPDWSEDKKQDFTITNDGNYHEYLVFMGSNDNWTDTITGIRIDPADHGITGTESDTIGFDYIKLVSTTTITSEGGTASSLDGSASVYFPPEVIPEDTFIYIAITMVDEASVPPPTGGLQLLGSVYDFSAVDAEGNPVTEFDDFVQITLQFDPADLNGLDPVIHYYDGESWVALQPPAQIVDYDNNTVTAFTKHFSWFGIFGIPEPSTLLLFGTGLLGILILARRTLKNRK